MAGIRSILNFSPPADSIVSGCCYQEIDAGRPSAPAMSWSPIFLVNTNRSGQATGSIAQSAHGPLVTR